MPKKLILCLDGTSNRFRADNTNVVKFLAVLDKNAINQALYYQPGIGTLVPPGIFGAVRRWIVTRWDLAFGTLLKYHVQDAYSFLMEYYEAGDEIHLLGFSRGAYTARVLAGMLHKVGLIARGNGEMVPFAWAMYQGENNDDLAHSFRNTLGTKVAINFLGLWDTVSSIRWAWFDRSYAFTWENPSVMVARHAVSLDERRAYFRQNLLAPPSGPAQDVLEVWFAGVHCDVGGGYVENESGLSKIALSWMIHHAQVAGVKFHSGALDLMLPATSTAKIAAPDPDAILHRSLRGLWWLLEFIPKRYHDPKRSYRTSWYVPLGRRRVVDAGAIIHQSILDRKAGVADYIPPNLPTEYRVNGDQRYARDGSATTAETASRQ